MEKTQIDIFQGIEHALNNLLEAIKAMSLNDRIQEIQVVMSILITLTIMYKGYMVLAGKSSDPIRELVWDISRKLFILTFAMGAGAWLNMSIDAIEGIHQWAAGDMSFFTQLDNLTANVLDFVNLMWNQSSGVGESFFAVFTCLITIGVFLAVVIELFFAIISSSISNAFLIVVLPLALICFMWNQTKQVFTQWCQLVLANTFTLLFLSLFAQYTQTLLNQAFSVQDLKDFEVFNVFQTIIEIVLMGFVIIQIVKVLKTLAQNLAQVSLESAMSGLGASQASGFMAGKALGFAGGVAGGAAKMGIGAFAARGAGGIFQSAAAGFAKGGVAGAVGGAAISAGKAMLSKMRGK